MLHSPRVYTDPSLLPPPSLSVVKAQTPSASAHVDLSCTCTAYEPLSDPPSSSLAACDGSTSPWQAATRRTVDPYEACRCQLDHFVQLQEEQIALMQQLQQSLALSTVTDATVAKANMSDNAENVHPDASQGKGRAANDRSTLQQQRKPGLLSKSASTDHLRGTPDVSEGHYSSSATPSSLVYRLRVLQHESAELASTRCYPALTHLLSTFDAYWTWKQTNMGDIDRQNMSAHQTTQQRQTPKSEGGGEERNGGAITDGSASSLLSSSCTSSLRQRYDHAMHVRDELESFLQLHQEAVRALQPYLQKCLQTATTAGDIKSPSHVVPLHDQRQKEKKKREAQHAFALYVQELLEVAQTVRHVACLLLTALAALCRPSPRLRDSRSDSINNASSRCRTPATSANVQGLSRSTGEAPTALQAGVVSGLSEETSSQRGSSTLGERGTVGLLTSSMQGKQERVSTSDSVMPTLASSRTTAPLPHSPKAAARPDDAWAAALSPLTPQPKTSTTKTAPAEPVGGEPVTSQTLFSSSPSSSPSPRLVSPSQERREQRRSRRSAEASLSTTAAVSLSPLTAARHEGTVRDAARGSGKGSRSRSPSTSPFTHLSGYEKHPDGVCATAAVSPAVVAPKEVDKRDEGHHRKGGSGGVRSLLMELTSAQSDDGATSRAASMPLPTLQKIRATPFRDANEEGKRDEEVVVHVPEDELRSVSPREPEEHTRIGRSRSCSSAGVSTTRSAGREESGEAGSVGRAASIPSVWWPRLTSTAAPRDSSIPPSGTVASEATGEVGDVFYTAPSLVASELWSRAPPAPPTAFTLAEQSGTVYCRSPSPPSAAPSAPTAVSNDDAPAALAVEVEALEREADAIQARLQRSAQMNAQQRRRSRRSTRSPSSVGTSSSSSDAASEVPFEQHRQRHHRHRRRSTTTERRLTRTLHKELERVRAGQQRSLEQMQRDVREALDEVVSVATAAAETAASSCSRASSRDSHTRAEREAGAREGLRGSRSSSSSRHAEAVEEEERGTSEVRQETKAGAGSASVSPHQQQHNHSASTHPVRQTSEAETEELRASLAAAEARAARLEQQSIQLKKRLWLAEELSDVSAGATAAAAAVVPPERGGRHVSLRNAFIYGDASAPPQETREARGDSESGPLMTGTKGVQVEEEALLYLVDRALSERRAQRGGALCREEWLRTPHTPPSTAGPPLAAAAMKTTATPAVSSADSSSPLKCFDDGVENAWGQQQRVPASGRSPLLRQQRASIFERLRRSITTPAAVVLRPSSGVVIESEGAAAARATLTHGGNEFSSQTAAPREDGEEGRGTAQLDPSPSLLSSPQPMPLHPYSSSIGQSKAFTPAPVRPSLAGSRRGGRGVGTATSSSYYNTISYTDSSASNAAHYVGEDKGGSALRARQVLHNARRLLQGRRDVMALRGGAVNGEVSYREEEFSGSQVSGQAGRYVNESGELCHPSAFSFSPSAAHATQQGSSAVYSPLPPPPPYASLLNTPPAASSTTATAAAAAADVVAAHRVPPPMPELQRLADTRYNTHAQFSSGYGDCKGSRGGVYDDVGGLRSPSAEVRPFAYDASPCAAVDYTTSKLPRPSMHVEREACNNLSSSSSISIAGRAPNLRRVDSATSPVAAPRSCSRRSRVEENEEEGEEESDTSSSGGSGASDSHVQLPRRVQSVPSQRMKHDGQHQEAHVHTRRSSTSFSMNPPEALRSASEQKEGARRPSVVGTHRHHSPSPRVRSSGSGSRQDVWQHQMVSRASSKASSTSSRGSAQADLLDTLTQQESLLRRALAQLQTQQRQLAEKRREVAQVAAAKGLQVQSGCSTTDARGGRGKSASPGQAASPQLRKVVELLDRLTAAEGVLASKVDRVEEAVATIQRQRSALVSDDFL